MRYLFSLGFALALISCTTESKKEPGIFYEGPKIEVSLGITSDPLHFSKTTFDANRKQYDTDPYKSITLYSTDTNIVAINGLSVIGRKAGDSAQIWADDNSSTLRSANIWVKVLVP